MMQVRLGARVDAGQCGFEGVVIEDVGLGRTVDGLGMLLHQGARAFRQWTGRKPPVPVMRAALEKALKAKRP